MSRILVALCTAALVLPLDACSHDTRDGLSACASQGDCPAPFPFCRSDMRCWSTAELSDAGDDGRGPMLDAGADASELLDAGADASDAASFRDAGDAGGADDASAPLDAADAASPIDSAVRADASGPCLPQLPDVGTGDFVIELDLRLDSIGTHAGPHALASQRSVCMEGHFWELAIDGDGFLELATDDVGVHTVILTGCHPVHDGLAHHVVVQRVGGVIDGFVDDEADLHADASSVSLLDSLPALTVGRSACATSGVADFPVGGANSVDVRCIRTVFEPRITGAGCI